MKIIDANSGVEVKKGVPFTNIHGTSVLVGHGPYDDPWALFKNDRIDAVMTRLTVRNNHPAFPGQEVGFIES